MPPKDYPTGRPESTENKNTISSGRDQVTLHVG